MLKSSSQDSIALPTNPSMDYHGLRIISEDQDIELDSTENNCLKLQTPGFDYSSSLSLPQISSKLLKPSYTMCNSEGRLFKNDSAQHLPYSSSLTVSHLGFTSLKPPYAPCNSDDFYKVPSFSSFNFLSGSSFMRIPRRCKSTGFLEGPRRVLKLCFVGLLLPIIVISIPIYVRLILFPPSHIMMASTDQRLLDYSSSTVWCQSQKVQMNGSFNAFLMDQRPKIQKSFSIHSMVQHLILKDDVKEYWGFFLQKGSLVSIDLCNKYDGGMLMIMKGAQNLRKCAWIGEEDSAEQDEDHKEDSNESGQIREYQDFPLVLGEILMESDDKGALEKENINAKENDNTGNEIDITSMERKEEIDFYVKKLMKISKNKKEIIESIKHQIPKKNFFPRIKVANKNSANNDSMLPKINITNRNSKNNDSSLPRINITNKNSKNNEYRDWENDISRKTEHKLKVERVKRFLSENIEHNGEIDILDGQQKSIQRIIFPSLKNESHKVSNSTKEAYSHLFKLPKELIYDRGNIVQTTPNDTSEEEHESSFSSSEEALTKCDGVIGAMPLYPSRKCNSVNDSFHNKVRYRIPSTGTYYFVFSSDNEVFNSSIHFNLTLHQVVFNTDSAKNSCINQTDCNLALSFWSHDQAVVEISEIDWNAAYELEVKCQPRVSIYLLFIFLMPILILYIAYR